jgi:hypothetical protein
LNKFKITQENDKRLFLSAFAALKSISDGNSHHLLIYANNKTSTIKLTHYIKLLLEHSYFCIPELFYSEYHSEMKSTNQKAILEQFEKSTYGIITCVYCLGEGWDFPLLDGVVFAENMSSNIRIVQSVLRASRKNRNDESKITKIILPILNKDDWMDNNNQNSDLKKVREVIYQMGLEDETISQKIKVCKMNVDKQQQNKIKKHNGTDIWFDLEYEDELTKQLKLKTVKRTALTITYEKAKQIIASQRITSKEEYYDLCDKDNRLSKEPEMVFKKHFINWIDYLSIERKYYNIETCKMKTNEYIMRNPDIYTCNTDLATTCFELCHLDKMFPPSGLWIDYYNVYNLSDIITFSDKKKKQRIEI